MQLATKIIVFFFTSAAILAANVMFTYGQGTAFGLRITPSRVPSSAVENPSPSNIYNRSIFDFNNGIYALKYFRSSRWGCQSRIGIWWYT